MKLAIAIIGLLALPGTALAHGGGGFRGPSGGVPPGLRAPDPLVCDCARPDCTNCSHAQLVSGKRLTRKAIARTVSRRWDDFAAIRIVATFGTNAPRPIEAYAELEPAALFAVVAGSIAQSDSTLRASLRPSRDARRRYLYSVQRSRDPFLVLRAGPGRYHLRAFPVDATGDTVVTIDGVGLAAPRRRGAPRLYRTGDRVLVVSDGGSGGAFVDRDDGRELRFLPLAEAREQYGDRAASAERVPFVRSLETAASGRGAAAVGDATALTALEPGAELPPEVAEPPPPPVATAARPRRAGSTPQSPGATR